MSSKTIGDLREAMFDTIEGLKSGKISVEQAKAVSDLGQVIINTAKVEVDYLKVNSGGKSGFIDESKVEQFPPGVTAVHRHRMLG